ncbi:hypothetical protein Tco_0720320 [Tanacetum coccineum]
MNSSDPSPSCRLTKVEVPKELPKVSMVNTSLKKLKLHLVGFDMVVKERTTATAIIEGSWGFEHTKACFRDEIIPLVKALKTNSYIDQYLIDELTEVQNVFHQMEQAVEQHSLESKMFEVKMNKVLNENERLLEQVINKDIVNIIVNSSVDNASVNMHECKKCLKLETELLNKKDFIEKETYDKLFRSYTTLEKHCISLEVDTQLNQEIFQRDNSVSNQSAPNFDQYFELNELKAQSQEKDTVTYKQLYDSIKPTRIRSKEECDALINQVNQKSVEISDLNVSLQEKGLVITTLKDELRKLKGKDLADNIITNHTALASTIQNSKLNANSELLCVKCNGCMLSDNHDLCVLDFINDVNLENVCPLTRITTTTEVPIRKPTVLKFDTPKPVVTLVYSRKPKKSKTNVHVSKPKIIKSISANNKEPSKSWGSTVSDVPYSSLDECRIMSITKDQQQALDDALVPREQCLRIGNCNYRLSTTFKPKEPTFQIALDVLSLTPFYQAFLISASVPVIYMHELWATVSFHKQCIKFKLNKKNHSFDPETFRDMLQICPNLPGQKFVDPPFEEEILAFIRKLGYSEDIKSLSDVKVDTLHQPWRTFRTIINKCLSGKVTGLDQLRLFWAQIMWGTYYQKNVDYVYLLWEDLVY